MCCSLTKQWERCAGNAICITYLAKGLFAFIVDRLLNIRTSSRESAILLSASSDCSLKIGTLKRDQTHYATVNNSSINDADQYERKGKCNQYNI